MTRVLQAVAIAVFCGVVATAAEAGIYKCTGPDGKTRYTSDPSHCPNAERQVLKKKVQKVLDDSATQRRSTRPAARRVGARGDGLESMWKGKRPAAERKLAEAEERLVRMNNVIKACNRGGEWYKTDESGMRTHIPCSELREKLAAAEKERDDLRHYLAEGLEDECRQAGCQPGWVR